MALDRNNHCDEMIPPGGAIRDYIAPFYDDTAGETWEDFPEDKQNRTSKSPPRDPRIPAYQYIDNRQPPPGYDEPDRDPGRQTRSVGAAIMDQASGGVSRVMGELL